MARRSFLPLFKKNTIYVLKQNSMNMICNLLISIVYRDHFEYHNSFGLPVRATILLSWFVAAIFKHETSFHIRFSHRPSFLGLQQRRSIASLVWMVKHLVLLPVLRGRERRGRQRPRGHFRHTSDTSHTSAMLSGMNS